MAITAGVARIAPAREGWNVLAGIELAHKALARRTESCKRVVVMTNGIAVLGVRPLVEQLARDNITMSAVGLASSNQSTLETIGGAGRGRGSRERPSKASHPRT